MLIDGKSDCTSHSPYLLSDFFLPGTALSTLCFSPHTDTTSLWDGCYYPHSMDEETEAQNGKVFSPNDPMASDRARIWSEQSGCRGQALTHFANLLKNL